jgi:GT2 family glycosyltransferase
MTRSPSPVVLFVYNRPEHTRRTLEALKNNDLACESKLYIFADGLKADASEEDQQRLQAVRSLIREKSWCGAPEIIESDTNKGLAHSIRSGITQVLDKHDRVIVLEDDLETSPGFLAYMNEALETYKDENRVFQVSGFMVRNRPWAPPTGFLRVSTSWGWATWRRAWDHYRHDAPALLKEVAKKGKSAFDLEGFSFHVDELERNVRGDLNTWAVRWYASIFLNDGLCLYPRKSLVRNLGFDGTGTHCNDSISGFYRKMSLAKKQRVKRIPIEENPHFLEAMQRHYREVLKEWTGSRLRDRLNRKLKRATGLN